MEVDERVMKGVGLVPNPQVSGLPPYGTECMTGSTEC